MRRPIQPDKFSSTFMRMGFANFAAVALLLGAMILNSGTSRATTDQWVPTGGLEGGTIGALAIDPQNPTTVYAGTSGVFKSSDGGASWSAVNTGLTNLYVLALAINPQSPATVYAATFAGGVFKSSNGGASWSAVNTGLTATSVLALAINPQSPATVYAGTNGAGVFKSSDGGASWSAVNSGLTLTAVASLAVDPQSPATVYAGIPVRGVFKTSNGGTSWSTINTGLTNLLVMALAISPQSPATVYAGTFGGAFRLDDVFASTFFPQVAVGGGWDTLFTVINTGSTEASGNLILMDPQGNPIAVSGVLTDSFGTTQPAFLGYSFGIYVPAGGTVFFSASALNPNDPTKTGWAQLDSTGGSLTGVATYEYVVGGIIQTIVGVLQSPLLQFATIPVDNDNTQAKQMAYAIANPSGQTISIKLALVGQDGIVVDDTVTVTLDPGKQIARYLWQDLLVRTNFKGSLVLRGQAGASFIAVALVQKQGLFTVIPLVPKKAPGVPD